MALTDRWWSTIYLVMALDDWWSFLIDFVMPHHSTWLVSWCPITVWVYGWWSSLWFRDATSWYMSIGDHPRWISWQLVMNNNTSNNHAVSCSMLLKALDDMKMMYEVWCLCLNVTTSMETWYQMQNTCCCCLNTALCCGCAEKMHKIKKYQFVALFLQFTIQSSH